MSTTRPNILFIMSDEHDAGVTGCYGDPLVQTPNLDALAADGIRLDGCYCASPLCVPARLAFTAGRHVHRIGGWNNTCWIDQGDDAPGLLPRQLRAAGYTPYLCGKQHYDRQRRYGFVDLMPGHSNHGHKRGTLERRVVGGDGRHVGYKSWHARTAQFGPSEDGGIMGHDRLVTELGSCFLRDRKGQQGDQPYFLFAGYLAPHFPLLAPGELIEKYKGKVPPPPAHAAWLAGAPRNYHCLREWFGVVNASEQTTDYGRACYWALVDWMDQQIGQLLQALEESGEADNTIVVYTTDHGENKGDHGQWWKNNMFEHSARVPAIIRWPGRWAGGQVRHQACSHLDLVQTILAVTGAEPFEEQDGDDMSAWLDDEQAEWKDQAVSIYFAHNIHSGMSMIRQGPWKYIHHARADEQNGPERELYHLADDPNELSNLAADADQQSRIEAMHADLVAELGEEPDAIEQRLRRERAEPYAR